MIPLGGTSWPQNRTELAAALRDGLAGFVRTAAGRDPVHVEGDAWPALARLRLELTGATVAPGGWEAPGDVRPTGDGVEVDRLEVEADPFVHGGAEARFQLQASGARLAFAHAVGGRHLLLLEQARSGRLRAAIGKEALQALALEQARALAAKHGVTVLDVRLDLASSGPRALRVSAWARMRKMLTAEVTAEATLEVGDDLTAHVRAAAFRAGGFLGALLGGRLDELARSLHGRRFPLAALRLGEIRLHDVRVAVDDGLQVEASFGARLSG